MTKHEFVQSNECEEMTERDDGEWCCWADVETREAWWRAQLVECGRNAADGARKARDEAYAMNERLTDEVERLTKMNDICSAVHGHNVKLAADNVRLRAALADALKTHEDQDCNRHEDDGACACSVGRPWREALAEKP